MKKLLTILMACLLLATLAPVSGALAQSEPAAIVIGDGAPIPYLDGFESRLVKDADTIAGITGAFPDGTEISVVPFSQSPTGTWRYELENLVLTDDVLGLFFKQTYSEPIPYADDMPYNFEQEARLYNILVDGEFLTALSEFHEGRPIDANAQYGFILWSLPEPIRDGQTLTFGAEWNSDWTALEGGIDVTVDRSQANDPTVVYQPSLNVKQKMALWEGNAPVNYDFTVARVAYTPFGSRMLIRFRGTCEFNQYLDYRLRDDSGVMLPVIQPTQISWIDASAEHPMEANNEAWFFGGEDSQSLTVVPVGGNWQDSKDARRIIPVALDSLPASVELENGATLRVEGCDLTDSGFYALYKVDGYAGSVSFDLGDADGTSLELPYGFYLLDDHSRGLLGYGGIWTEEYDGKIVSRVTPEQLAQIKTLLVDYTLDFPALIEDEAFEIVLSK